MSNKIKDAFDNICAGEKLKANTILFLQSNIQRNTRRKFTGAGKVAAAFIFLTVAVAGIFSYNLYFTENAYVDLDVNPSIEFAVNGFDRVISVYAYNKEGEFILSETDIIHKNYKEALETVMDSIEKNGFTKKSELISVTLQTDDKSKENEMLLNIKSAVTKRQDEVQVSAFPVDGETREAARSVNLSPAKYLAILELFEVDSTATFDGCRNHSISEIKKLTEEHSGNHHGGHNHK